MYYVYIIKSSKTNRYYTGYTGDLKKRLAEHNSGANISTKYYLPWKIISYMAFKEEETARQFEKYLKSGSGIAFRNRHLI
jgi:predicted GIY-YIG superfamily endonuclease